MTGHATPTADGLAAVIQDLANVAERLGVLDKLAAEIVRRGATMSDRSVDLVTIPFLNKRIDARLQVDGKSTDTVATELRNTKTFIRRSAADKKLFRDGVKRLDEVSVEGKRNKGKPQLHS